MASIDRRQRAAVPPTSPRPTGVVWFRRDLRLADNPTLTAALRTHDAVVALFVWDERLLGPAGAPRVAFLVEALRALDRDLGGRLLIRSGDPVDVVPAVAHEVEAEVVWSAADFGPYGHRRDRGVAEALAARGLELRQLDTPYAVAPGDVTTVAGGPFRVFTPFSAAWRAQGWAPPIPRPPIDPPRLLALAGDDPPVPELGATVLPRAGEGPALERLEHFLTNGLARYDGDRDRPDLDGTSRLSPYLKFGCIHPRQILDRLDPSLPGHRRFETELCWREFYADVLFHRPDSARAPYRIEWEQFEVDRGAAADARFDAWAHGRTGVPIVDAGMRQLLGEAWMHNRVRMIVASYLVKDLHLDWRLGARWFLEHLVDGDLASNQHGWQWVAGTGTDAAPYFRIFNPVLQGQRFDPDGHYIRRWVPELAGLATPLVHEPWKVEASLFSPAIDYPSPLVDHAEAREESLARYRRLRAGRAVT